MATNKAAKPATLALAGARLMLILADDIRLERDGKITAVGLYTDRVIVGLMNAGVPDPTESTPMALGGKAFVVSISGLEGPHAVSMGYFDPTLPVLSAKGPQQEFKFPSTDLTANLVGRFDPLIVGGFGIKKVLVSIDGRDFELTFEVRRGESPAGPDAQTQQPKQIERAAKPTKRKRAIAALRG